MVDKERRDKGDGSFKKLPNGTVEYTVSCGIGADGKRQRPKFYGQNPTDCKRQYKQWMKDVGQKKAAVTEYTLGGWLDRWLQTYKGKRIPAGEKQIAQSTIDEYMSLAERVKKYKIANKPLMDIKPIMLSEFFHGDFSKFSHTIIKKTRFLLNAAFEAAVDNDYCYKNPMRNVAIPQKQQGKKAAYDDDSIKAIVRFAARDKGFGACMLLMLGTGMRAQELRALQIDHIDYANRTVNVEWAIKESGLKGVTKNRLERTIPITRALTKHLKKALNGQSGYVLGGNNYVVRDTLRSAYEWFFIRLNRDREAKKLKPIKQLPPHCCRHTYSTVLQRKGVPLPVVAALLGHKSVGVTERYTHLDTLEDMRKAINGR